MDRDRRPVVEQAGLDQALAAASPAIVRGLVATYTFLTDDHNTIFAPAWGPVDDVIGRVRVAGAAGIDLVVGHQDTFFEAESKFLMTSTV
jgi:hypothetical protein